MRNVNQTNKISQTAAPLPPGRTLLGFLHFPGSKGRDSIRLSIAVLLAAALFIYAGSLWRGSSLKIKYTPADITYGEKIHAVHDMGSANYAPFSEASATDSALKPDIRLSENFYDFGKVDARQVLTRTFVIANFGEFPLIIRHAYTTCGCTVADFTADEIPPGKVALMTLKLDTGYHDMGGTTVRRGVVIETNDPDHPTQEIWIQASVR